MPTVKATFTADISQFQRSLAQASTVVTAFDRTVGQTNAALKRFGNEFSGAKVQRDALTIARAIQDIGGATRLTDSELKRASGTINEALQKYQRLGKEAPASLRQLSSELQKLQAEGQKVAASVGGIGTSISKGLGALTSGLGIGVGAGLGLGAITAVGAALRDMAGEAARLTPLSQSFERLQGGAAKAQASLLNLRVATKGLVSDADLLQAANKGALLGLQDMGIQFDEVARVATTLGRAMGEDATKSVDDLTTALSRMSPQILDNLGIKVDLTAATEAYAASIGKSASALTEEERKLAFATAAMQAARDKAAALGDAQLTVWEQTTRVATALSGMAVEVISLGNESNGLAGALGSVADALERMRSSGPGAFRQMAREADLTLKTMLQFAPSGSLGGGPFGALMQSYLQLRMGAPDPVDLSILGAARRGSDISLNSPVTKQAEAVAKHTQAATKAARDLKKIVDTPLAPSSFLKAVGASLGVNQNLTGTFGRTGIAGAIIPDLGAGVPGLPSAIGGGSLSGFNARSFAGITVDLQRGLPSVRNWRVELQGIAQAFGQLGSVAGGALNGVTRSIGTAFTAANAGVEIATALSKQFKGLSDGKGGLSAGGRALSGALSGLGVGLDLGGLFTNRGAGFAAGAAGGAATGAMAGGWVGAGVGALVGGISGIFAAAGAAKNQRRAKDVQAAQLTAQFGGLDPLLDTVGRLGLNQQTFLERFYGDPKAFAKGVSELNAALEKEKQTADRLAKSLQSVSQAHGVLSREDMQRFASLRTGGPGDAARGEFLSGQTSQLVGGLTTALQSGVLSPTAIGGAGASLGAAFGLLREQGLSTVDAIKQLQPALEAFQQHAVAAGKGSTAEFDALKSLMDTMTSETLGPFIDSALGSGQALAALANTGTLTQDMFAGLSTAISDAYFALERDGRGGAEAVRLLQGPLQNIWQLMQDQGLVVDENTQRLIDFATEAGLLGDKFRPAADQMVAALDKIIGRLDEILGRFAAIPGSVPVPGGGGEPDVQLASGGIVTRPTVALVGEAGPEAVIPLSKLRNGGGGTREQTIQVMLDGRLIASTVARELPRVVRLYTGVA